MFLMRCLSRVTPTDSQSPLGAGGGLAKSAVGNFREICILLAFLRSCASRNAVNRLEATLWRRHRCPHRRHLSAVSESGGCMATKPHFGAMARESAEPSRYHVRGMPSDGKAAVIQFCRCPARAFLSGSPEATTGGQLSFTARRR